MAASSPFAVRLVQRLEGATELEALAQAVAPLADAVMRLPVRDQLLGDAAGHALHPALTDVPVGAWLSASLLDVAGGADARPAARLLVGVGVLAAVPTAVTGLAEWSHTDTRSGRVGALHAAGSAAGLVLQAVSWVARRRGAHGAGAALSLVGTGLVGASAYLGGHLAVARNVGSRDRAFADSLPRDDERADAGLTGV